MLTAGDEFGRTQMGNNNAYAQDNAIGWLDWQGRDREIEAHAFALAGLRASAPDFSDTGWLSEDDIEWLDEQGRPMTVAQWKDADRRCLAMRFRRSGFTLLINGDDQPRDFGDVRVPARTVLRSAERRVGKEGERTVRLWGVT